MVPILDDAAFVQEFQELGATALAKKLGINVRNVFERRKRLEKKLGIEFTLPATSLIYSPTYKKEEYPERVHLELLNGVAFLASDFHYWPGKKSTIHRAIVKMAKELKPNIFVANGDICDFASISRHPPIGWEGRPSVQQEIEVCQERLYEIIQALPKGCKRTWNLGNHDGRFETLIATKAPELAKIAGVHLHDHFPDWERGWLTFINNDVVIKHRYKGGKHAPYNNTLHSGKNTFTSHLHNAKIIPVTDYNGTRYGGDMGCVADVEHKAFVDYTEGSPKDWRSAFMILTFWRGKLLQPELVLRLDDERVEFRGKVIEV